jgi:hypothetical protein
MTQDNLQAENPEAGAPKIKAMRRQPCPCGSGKVFKNCHEGDPGYEVATDATTAIAAPPSTGAAGPKAPSARSFQPQAAKFNSAARNTGVKNRRKV